MKKDLAVKYINFIFQKVFPVFFLPIKWFTGIRVDTTSRQMNPETISIASSNVRGRPFFLGCGKCRLTVGAVVRTGNPDDGLGIHFAIPNFCPCCGEESNISPETMLAYQQLDTVSDDEIEST